MRRYRISVWLSALALGCGPSPAEIRNARLAVYHTEFALVWNATVAAVRRDYQNVKIEDAVKGELVTDWHKIGRPHGEDPTDKLTVTDEKQGDKNRKSSLDTQLRPAMLFKVTVKVKGGPPWKVVVDGEAARFDPDLALLTPYKHGMPDEPQWVQGRIDSLRYRIYQRLSKFAVVPKELPPPKPKAIDTSAWPTVPTAAAEVIAHVHQMAARKKASALREFMGDTFSSSVGDDLPAEHAITLWSADPSRLSALAALLKAGCKSQDKATVVCGNAVFALAGGTWRFVALGAE